MKNLRFLCDVAAREPLAEVVVAEAQADVPPVDGEPSDSTRGAREEFLGVA